MMINRTTRYDAFISYSHAADTALARALGNSLPRFATSWNPFRRQNPVRSIRVFRDESALSADPSLWPAIERALAASDWLILLASVDGAKSKWIDKEVDYWCANKPKDRILLVLSDGELAWDDDSSDFDWHVTTALSRRFAGVFAEEPLWVDLRWTKTMRRLSVRDPRFRETVASIASPLRGIPKDELIGADIRQHQKLQRWRNAAMVILSILLIGALVAAEIARRQRGLALERESEAIAERARAERQAEIALARQLAAQSVQSRLQSVARIELSLLLAVESTRRDPALAGVQALAQALALTPKRIADFRHRLGLLERGAVWAIAYSPDGRLLASASGDGSIALWRIGGEQVWHLPISTEPVRDISFRPDGNTLATAGKDGTAALWRVDNGEQVARFNHEGPVMDLDFDHTGQFLATASDDGTARIWEVDKGIEIGRISYAGVDGDLARVKAVAFSPDGQMMAAINYGGRVCLWDVTRRKQARCMLNRRLGLHLAFSADSRLLATASENFASIWEVVSGELQHRFEHPDLLGDANMAHTLWIEDIAFHPDGRFLASTSRREVRLWDLSNNQEALRLEAAGPVSAVAFSPDGRMLAAATAVGTVRIWELLSGRELLRAGLEPDSPIYALSFSPDGARVAAANMSTQIGVWSVRSAIEVAQLRHPDDAELVALSPDGRYAATAADDQIIRLWDRENSQQLAEINRFKPRRIVFSDDSRGLAVLSLKGGLEVMAVDEKLAPFQVKAQPLRGDAILTPRYILLERRGGFDVWRTATGDKVAQGLGRQLSIEIFTLNSDANLLATAYRDQKTVEIWNIAEALKVGEVPIASRAHGLSLSPDGDRLAVILGQRPESASRYAQLAYRIEVRKIKDGRLVAQLPLDGLQPVSVNFLPDGQRLLVVAGHWQFPDGIHVLHLSTPVRIVSLRDTYEVASLRLAPDNQHLAAISRGRARVWNLITGRAVAELPIGARLRDIRFSSDGRYLVTASDDDNATFWLWRADDLLEQACARLTRNLTQQEWRDFLPGVDYRPTCANLPPEGDRRE